MQSMLYKWLEFCMDKYLANALRGQKSGGCSNETQNGSHMTKIMCESLDDGASQVLQLSSSFR